MNNKTSRIQKSLLGILILFFVAFAVTRLSTITVFAEKGLDSNDPFTTEAEVGAYLKSQLMLRTESFPTVYYQTTEKYGYSITDSKEAIAAAQANWEAFLNRVYGIALTHAGPGTENGWKQGDYIRHNLGTHGGGFDRASYNPTDQTYTYNIVFSAAYLASAKTYADAGLGSTDGMTAASMEAAVTQRLDSLVDGLYLVGKTDYEKIVLIHNTILDQVTYSTDHMDDTDPNKIYHSTYAATKIPNGNFNGTCVCQGYATMFYYMALKAGVDCRIITGTGKSSTGSGPHAWNIVKLDGQWYNLDVTWDSNYKDSIGGNTNYTFFLKSASDFAANHVRNAEYSTDEFNQQYPMVQEGDASTQMLGCNVFVFDYIAMKWYVAVPTPVTESDVSIVFSFPDDPNGEIYKQTKGIITTSPNPTPVDRMDNKNVYCFMCNIPVYKLCDKVSAQLLIGNTSYATYTTSFKKYADALLSDPDFGTKQSKTDYTAETLKALLYYGKYAQAYFNPSATGDPAEMITGTDPIPDLPVVTTDAADNTITGTQQGISYYGTSLILRDNVVIRHYFTLSDTSELEKYSFKWGNTSTTVHTDKNFNTNKLVYVDSDPLNYNLLNTTKQITVSREGNAVLTFNYNSYNYIKSVFDKNTSSQGSVPTELLNLLRAFYNYSKKTGA